MTGLLTHSQARGLAESMWGPGGTTASRTNRTGAFYFSCSGHGGFVIDDRALTDAERGLLTAGGFKADACWGVRAADGRIVTVRHPHSEVQHPRRVNYHPSRGETVDRAIPVWVFEEDCDWAAVYVLTNIRVPAAFSVTGEAKLITYARECLFRWNPEAAKVAEVADGLAGYDAATVASVITEAAKFPCRWAYTPDRARAVCYLLDGKWEVRDTAETENRIAALAEGHAR